MKLIKSDGCTTFWTRLDGIDLKEIDLETKKIILKLLIRNDIDNKIDDVINSILDILNPDEFTDDYCDQCNDNIYQKTFEI